MQKTWSKQIALGLNIPTAPFIEIDRNFQISEIEQRLSYPLWVKPVHLGSSIGVSRAGNREELISSIHKALQWDDRVLVETEVNGRQIEFSLLGNDFIRIAPSAELIDHGSFVSFDKKYGPKAIEIRVPAQISETEQAKGEEFAKKIYHAFRCQGLARIDFFLTDEGAFFFNEINPFPGFTETSAYPKSWGDIPTLIDELMILALHKKRKAKRP